MPADGTTPFDTDGLIPKLRTRRQIDEYEVRNVLDAHLRYMAQRPTLRRAPFDLNWVLRLHKQMFGKVWSWAGTVRDCELNLGAPVFRIRSDLMTLLDDLNYWRQNNTYPQLEQSARLHHRAVAIHPFRNGNGRWARLLANIYLRQIGHRYTIWPDVLISDTESEIRAEYLTAVHAADENNYTPLISLHQRYS